MDVRTLEEYNSDHIKDAVLLPVNNVRDKADEILTDTNAKILVYYRSGNRSAVALLFPDFIIDIIDDILSF